MIGTEVSAPGTTGGLPTGWRWARLGELATFINGRAFKPDEWSADGLPIVRIENLNSPSAAFNRYKGPLDPRHAVAHGDLLISWSASLDAYIWKRGPAALNQHIFKVTNCRAVSREYLYFAARAAMVRIRSQVHGATMRHITKPEFERIEIPVCPPDEQARTVAALEEQLAAVERAQAAAQGQLRLLALEVDSCLRRSFSAAPFQESQLADCLQEVTKGVGADWERYRVLGATRGGLAPAKERVGKAPERYKLVRSGTIFYNPMRILLGSIAFLDEEEEPGITSPDYVVFETRVGRLHPRWFYYWLRSGPGAIFVGSLARGAVRERMLFRRLAAARIKLPPWEAQVRAAQELRLIETARQVVRSQIGAIEALPLALLSRAFNGQL